ncbi:glycosyl transferase [Alkalilimnicola ehrlichii]|nr:glycosyl transferase [Alkalilimnicola ehrlichii]
MAMLGGGAVVAGIGYLDDHGDVAARWRLMAHFVAAFVALSALAAHGGLPTVPLGSWILDLGVFGYLFAALFIVWLLNLYNFMDGIDGLAGVELVTVSGGAALLLFWQGAPISASWLLLLAACGLGFLVWNWPPAKIFMGDAGSGFLGFVLAVFALWTGGEGGIGVWAWGILLGVFLVDATWTLIRRVSLGQRFYEAHRIHAYQYASREFGAHKPVTLGVAAINIGWLLPWAALATWFPGLGGLFLVIAWAPLVFLCWWFKAGVPESA